MSTNIEWEINIVGELVEIDTGSQRIRLTRDECLVMREILADALQLLPVEIKP